MKRQEQLELWISRPAEGQSEENGVCGLFCTGHFSVLTPT